MRPTLMSKKKTKKKTAKKTKKTTKRPPAKTNTTAVEFDDWATDMKQSAVGGCATCSDTSFAGTVQSLLMAMIRKKAHRIPLREILAAVQKRHPNSDIGRRSLERHLRVCVRPLYNRARGRKNV